MILVFDGEIGKSWDLSQDGNRSAVSNKFCVLAFNGSIDVFSMVRKVLLACDYFETKTDAPFARRFTAMIETMHRLIVHRIFILLRNSATIAERINYYIAKWAAPRVTRKITTIAFRIRGIAVFVYESNNEYISFFFVQQLHVAHRTLWQIILWAETFNYFIPQFLARSIDRSTGTRDKWTESKEYYYTKREMWKRVGSCLCMAWGGRDNSHWNHILYSLVCAVPQRNSRIQSDQQWERDSE